MRAENMRAIRCHTFLLGLALAPMLSHAWVSPQSMNEGPFISQNILSTACARSRSAMRMAVSTSSNSRPISTSDKKGLLERSLLDFPSLSNSASTLSEKNQDQIDQQGLSYPQKSASLRSSTTSQQTVPSTRTPSAPFPDGLCGGRIVTLAPSETYALDTYLAGNYWLLPPRPIDVWLPPGYGERGQRHPVLYVHDGKNAIEDASSWTGHSWRLAGALTRLAEHGCLTNPLPLLVLMPAASETASTHLGPVPRRHLEYGDEALSFAKAHSHFVARTLKPAVDGLFLTRPEAEATFLIGASLGGQASLNILLHYSDVFGGAACLSPAFGPSITRDLEETLSAHPQSLANKRLYLDMGGDRTERNVPFLDVLDHLTTEHWWNPGYFWLDTQLQSSVHTVVEVLQRHRHSMQYVYKDFPGERHNERAWSRRIDEPILHLFGRQKR